MCVGFDEDAPCSEWRREVRGVAAEPSAYVDQDRRMRDTAVCRFISASVWMSARATTQLAFCSSTTRSWRRFRSDRPGPSRGCLRLGRAVGSPTGRRVVRHWPVADCHPLEPPPQREPPHPTLLVTAISRAATVTTVSTDLVLRGAAEIRRLDSRGAIFSPPPRTCRQSRRWKPHGCGRDADGVKPRRALRRHRVDRPVELDRPESLALV